ncbi:hypothetical protein AB1Y20_010086 [Prymnesium parvum]|uniref:Ion transport domain-containing protein n=1 Tax=Prymnesium parvum TaxID=97485 RepID=A0AB34K3W2_PRYPA
MDSGEHAVNDATGLERLRRSLVRLDHMTNTRKIDMIYRSLLEAGYVEGPMAVGRLTTGNQTFNVFARVGAGLQPQPANAQVGWLGTEAENEKLGEYSDEFMVACNRVVNDLNWNKNTPDWVGKASMSIRHRFLILKDMSWWKFNVAVLGLRLDGKGKMQEEELAKAIKMLEDMIKAAKLYVKNSPEWSYHLSQNEDSIGLYFHAYPNSSVNSLHMHIVDIGKDSAGTPCCGPTFDSLASKNLPAHQALEVLKNEHLMKDSTTFLKIYDRLYKRICDRAANIEGQKLNEVKWSHEMNVATIAAGNIPREDGADETLLILAVRLISVNPNSAEASMRGEVRELVVDLLDACPVAYLHNFINAQARNGRTALQESLAAARLFNEEYADAITNGRRSREEPNLEILRWLITYGTDLQLRDQSGQSALAFAVASDFLAASRMLFTRLKPFLVDPQHATSIAASLYLNFQPFELFSNFIRDFPQRPGSSLLGLVRLANSTSIAAQAMRSSSSEVMLKYELVAESCSTVILALLKTLNGDQLYNLFINTRAGSDFLHSACSGGSKLMDLALSSEQVFVTIDKRWEGALLRLITKRHARRGAQVPLWKVVLLIVFLVVFCVPLNLVLLPAIVAYPPLNKSIRDALDELGEIQFLKAEPLSLEVKWRAIYLLQTPQFAFYIYIAAQLSWIFVFSLVPADPSPGVAFGVFLWSLLAAVAELNEVCIHHTKWESDWVNWIELPGLLVGFVGATNMLFGGPVAFSINARAVFSCMLFNAQGLRVLQIERRIGPLVLMLKSMLVDAFLWSTLVSVTLLSFAIGLNEALRKSIEHPELDSCNSVTFTESFTTHVPRMIVSMLGGGEEYIMCFSEVDDSQTAAILMTVFLGLTTIILINMLIAIMSKTFDSIFEDSENNYKVQRVRLFVAYADNADWPAPLNLLSLPYWLYTRSPKFERDENGNLKKPVARQISDSLAELSSFRAYQRLVSDSVAGKTYESTQPQAGSLSDAKREDIKSIEPALNDNESSAFQISQWQKSIDKEHKVDRAILPRKTLKWIDSLYRLESSMNHGSRSQLEPELLAGLKDGQLESPGEEQDQRGRFVNNVNKHDVYCTLGKFVQAHLPGAQT